MVGHANPHTMATLFSSEDARDRELIQLVFTQDGKISKKILDKQLSRAMKLDVLTGGISNSKLKKLTNAAKKASVEAEVKNLKSVRM